MLQSDRSTTALHADTWGEHDGSRAETAAVDLARNAVKRPDLMLKHGPNGALGGGASNTDANAGTPLPSSGRGQEAADLARIVSLPPLPRRTPAATLHALQEWEGYVVEIDETDFTARLIDLTAGADHEEEEAVIPIAELSDDDAGKMREGSVFRWVIGYERSPAGTKKRVFQIVFRDLPTMTEADLRAGKAWARETIRSFDP